MIDSAAAYALSVCNASIANGTTSSANSFAGSLQPITPVEDGMTELAPPGRLSFDATAAQTDSAAATPSPPGQTFDTLLLITIA
jgi:hypothetical protein